MASRNENVYRNLVDGSPGYLLSHTLDGKLLFVNTAAAAALGLSPGELHERDIETFVAPAYAQRVRPYLARLRRSGQAQGYVRLLTRGGSSVSWRYCSSLTPPAQDSRAVIVHAQNASHEIEEQQRLRETNKVYRCLYEEAPVAYHEIDAQGVVTNLNRAECDLLGWEKREVLGRPVWDLVAPEHREESRLNVLRKLAGDQPLVPFFREYVRHDGRRLILNIHENEIRSRTGEIVGIRSTLLDVTEQHRVESELRRLNTELDRRVAERTSELHSSNERMREFVYTVSHDLQEPLRSIGSFAKLLRERYTGGLDAAGVEFLDFVLSGTVRMSVLIRDLLAYSHVLYDPPDSFQMVDLDRVLHTVEEILSTSVAGSGAQITHTELPVLRANPNRLVQLFQNLIGNAIKYRGDAPPRIHVQARRQEDCWVIAVSDNGPGVPEEDRERIFGLFKRGQRGATPGSGVGLAICQAIVEKHGGRIWVEPAPGGGSVFAFSLPAR